VIDCTEQVAVVTGAGRGLGRLYAMEVVRRGGSVVVNDLGFSRMVTETVDSDTLENLGLLKLIGPEKVVPIATYLASRACASSHRNYSACAGRYARVFVGLGDGWHDDTTGATDPVFPGQSTSLASPEQPAPWGTG
jgi:hypothetical protein